MIRKSDLQYHDRKKVDAIVDQQTGNVFVCMPDPVTKRLVWRSPGRCGFRWGHEKSVIRFFESHVGQDTTFVDIGANHGRYSIQAAHQGARVVAVEAERRNLEMLYLNLESSRVDVEVVNAFVSDGTKAEVEVIRMDDSAMSGAYRNAPDNFPREKVRTTTLSAILSQVPEDEKKIVIKIDTEGCEMEVLRGMKELDPRIFAIVAEPHDVGDALPADIVSWGLSQGWKAYRTDGGRPLQQWAPKFGMNLITLAPESSGLG